MTAVVIVRHQRGQQLDATATANSAGVIEAHGNSLRLTATGAIAWIVDDCADDAALAKDVRSVWDGHDDVDIAVITTGTPAAPAAPATATPAPHPEGESSLQYQHSVSSIAQ
jgi:hypothetical protein